LSKLTGKDFPFLDKCFTLSKQERIMRVIQIIAKQDHGFLSLEEQMELVCIQSIRETNGELDEVRKERELDTTS
jgi:hypothetical protein